MNLVVLLLAASLPLFAQTYPHVSIQDIQKVPLDSLLLADTLQTSATRYTLQASPYNGDTLQVTGVVVVGPKIFGYNNSGWSVLLYDTANVDQWRGIWLRVSSSGDTAQAKLDGFDALEPGDIITVRGYVGEFPTDYINSLTQLNYLPGQQIIPIGTMPVPPPTRLSVSTFYDGLYPGGKVRFSTGEPYEDMYVEFTDLIVSSILNPANGTFNMVQGGNMISDYDASNYYTTRRTQPAGWIYVLPPVQAKVDTIRGVIWVVSGGNNPRGYHIAPVLPGDLVLGKVLPLVTDALRAPMVATPTDTVKASVRALVQTGGFAIDSVMLFYSFNDAPFVGQKMTLFSPADTTYQGVIPPAPDTTFVRYFYVAYDHAGDKTMLASYSSSASGDTSKGTFFYTVLTRPLTIRDIQYTPFLNGMSPYATGGDTTGALVSVSGIITADTTDISLLSRSTVGGTYGWYMQSGNAPWSGVWLFGDAMVMYPLLHGDSVTVTGRVQEWFSFGQAVTTRITNIHAAAVHSSGNPIPLPVDKSTGTFGVGVPSGDRNAEPYEGMLVRFRNAVISNRAPYFSDSTIYGINDGSGELWVHQDGANTFTNDAKDTVTHPTWTVLHVGDTLRSITGLIHFSTNQYKLVPRTNADFDLSTVGVEELPGLPTGYAIDQNYPNPFNPSTVIEYSLPSASLVTLRVFNILGQEVRTLVNTEQVAGRYRIRFDGEGLSTGMYLYRIQAGNFTQVRKMVFVK
jgi:hypothetical protein